MVGVAKAWVQANKIEQGRVEEGGSLTSFPGYHVEKERGRRKRDPGK